VHGFDEFYGNLYHLNAEEEPLGGSQADLTATRFRSVVLRGAFAVGAVGDPSIARLAAT
jgi:hypothetical protein